MLPEVIAAWKGLENTTLDGEHSLRLMHLESHERVPVFSGLLNGETPVMVRFFHEPEESTAIFDRHREAAFLSHPNLLPCLGTGFTTLSGDRFVYGVYESPNMLLSTLLQGKTFTPDETRSMCTDVLDGLEYLHGLGLVYCNLDRTTVARCGDRWKLCDYSELRPEGTGYTRETRRLLSALPGAPPEAFSGVVTPAWDCWSIAHLLRNFGEESFRGIAAACLLPDVGERCTTADIRRQILAEPVPERMVVDPEPEPIPSPVPPPAPWREPFSSAEPPRRRPGAAAMLVAGATAVALLIGVSTYLNDRSKSAVPAAQTEPAGEPSRARVAEPAPPAVEIRRVVDRWADAFRQRDIEAEIALYAPRVRRFYLSRNVSAGYVRQTKQSAIQSAGEIRRYEIDNVDTKLDSANAATVTFDKTWDFAGKTHHTGKVRSELKLEKQRDGAWRIVSERDLKVYRQTRARG